MYLFIKLINNKFITIIFINVEYIKKIYIEQNFDE